METCLRVIPVNVRVEQTGDAWLVLASVEVWDDAIVLRYAADAIRVPDAPSPPGITTRLMAMGWDVSDDTGTEYAIAGGGGGSAGADRPAMMASVFTPAPPADATVLRLFADTIIERPIEVSLR